MDKLKKVFTPGGSQDDEVMYGTPEPASTKKGPFLEGKTNLAANDEEAMKEEHDRLAQVDNAKPTPSADNAGQRAAETHYSQNTPSSTTAGAGDDSMSGSTSEGGKKEHGILRQILNPGGNKYDETAYGSGDASSTGRTPHHEVVDPGDTGKEHGIARQILNPGGNKYDEAAYGAPPSDTGSSTYDSSAQRYGSAAAPISGTSSDLRQTDTSDSASTTALKGGVPGPYSEESTQRSGFGSSGLGSAGGSSAAPQVPDKSTERYLGSDNTTSSTGGNFGRETSEALGLGAAGAGAGALASGAGRSGTTGRDDIGGATYTDRSFKLGQGDPTPSGLSSSHNYADPTSTAGVAGYGSKDSSALGYGDGREALAGTTGGAGAGALAGGSTTSGSGHSHEFMGAGSDKPYPGYVHESRGPHPTDIANRLDPHVPGEFPSESGVDRHSSGRGLGSGAALGGAGAGAAGIGAYEAGRDRDTSGLGSSTGMTSSTGAQGISGMDPTMGRSVEPSSTVPVSGYGQQTSTLPDRSATGTSGYPAPVSTDTSSRDHHYGRDAALAGGAGVAGAGAYGAYESSRGDTGPASKTIGPHSSNAANIVDPRVQPEPQKMKESPTTGPYQSDMLNRADPRVTSDPQRAAEQQGRDHHYGRDAAAVGGAGAAGYAAKEVYDDKEAKKMQKEHEKEMEKAAKQHDKDIKEHNKEVEKAQKERAKAAEKAEKEREKEADRSEKEAERDAKRHPDEGERKPSLMDRIFHRGSKDEKEEEGAAGRDLKDRDEQAHRRHQEELAAAGGAGAVGAGAYEADRHHHNKLHKEPPAGYAQQQQSHMGTDGPIGDERNVSGLSGVGAGSAAAAPGTSTLGHHGEGHEGHHHGGQEGIVIDHTTGLPMNVGKYGAGAGGTDGSRQIEGYHDEASSGDRRISSVGTAEYAEKKGEHAPSDAVGPDWDKIKKANTPY